MTAHASSAGQAGCGPPGVVRSSVSGQAETGAPGPLPVERSSLVDSVVVFLRTGGFSVKEPEMIERYVTGGDEVFRVRADATEFGVKVRTGPGRYDGTDDCGGFREPLVARLLSLRGVTSVGPAGACRADDREVGDDLRAYSSRGYGGPVSHPLVGDLFYFDRTREDVPLPLMIYRWYPGSVVSRESPDDYRRAGELLAAFHARTFRSHYDTLLSVGLAGGADTPWRDRARAAFERTGRAPGRLAALFDAVTDEPVPTLVHGGFYPPNVIVGEPGLRAIDWDGAAVAPREWDLVAMKYLTAPDDAGVYGPDDVLYSAFLEAYEDAAAADDSRPPVRHDVLAACEAVWLARKLVAADAAAARGDGPPARADHPGPDLYREALDALGA